MMQRIPRIPFFLFAFALSVLSSAENASGQLRNNPYSPSPVTKSRMAQVAVVEKADQPSTAAISASIEKPPAAAPKAQDAAIGQNVPINARPTDIYHVGAGDVLLIELKNAPGGSGYYTVDPDGSIDYPLAGETVIVAGKTADNIASMLRSAITLYNDPAVDVKVRDWRSHKITVNGLAEQTGERSIQRDAVPLFVVKAEVAADPSATSVRIHRASGAVESDVSSDDTLVFPGDTITFERPRAVNNDAAPIYYISGDVAQAGQHDLVTGMTLLQAVTASGGSRGNAKKAIIRRKGNKGNLIVIEFNIRSIKDGKATDPVLNSGDIIEISN
ncbi:MAG: polysaccharide biosynthesis/export family protein [Acidobacteria bacterium]|nr:polysaccharide biosynthesis/export family protein [Acidobacteriota bacterium]